MGFHPTDHPVDFRAFYPYTPNEVKHRKRTTSAQLKVLEAIFKKDTKPNATLRNELAQQLDMTARGVQVWFQNRRAKEKIKASKAHDKQPNDQQHTVKDEHDDLPNVDSPDAYSRASSSTSPPQLHLITDAANFPWQNGVVDHPPDSAATTPAFPTSDPIGLHGHNQPLPPFSPLPTADFANNRRGSLPANAFLQPEPSSSESEPDFDPFIRRRSVDASLQRLANNPFAGLARAKNTALYGPGFGVALPGTAPAPIPTARQSLNRLPYSNGTYLSQRRAFPSSFANMPQHASMRRLSMDSRSTRLPGSRLHHSPSPSPLTPFSAVVRASLPENQLYTVSSRTVASPIPGPLPSPGFSFGAATTPSMASPSSADSERNSPDSLRSFTFRNDDLDDDSVTSPSYDTYSRFGSVASIATSESSINSSYYSELAGDVRVDDRRDSCASNHQFMGLLPELDVATNHVAEHMQNNMALAYPHEGFAFAQSPAPPAASDSTNELLQEQDQRQRANAVASYPSPTSTISPRASQDSATNSPATPSSVPISTTSELAFALESKPDQAGNRQDAFLTYSDHQASSRSAAVANTHGHVDQQHTNTPEQDFYQQQQQQQQKTDGLYHHQDAFAPAGHYGAANFAPLGEVYPPGDMHQATQQQPQAPFNHLMTAYSTYGTGATSTSIGSSNNGNPTTGASDALSSLADNVTHPHPGGASDAFVTYT